MTLFPRLLKTRHSTPGEDQHRPPHEAPLHHEGNPAMPTATYRVSGMTCHHCVRAVKDEVGSLDGVTAVEVDLVKDGVSTVTVTSAAPLDEAAVATAVDEAGYTLAPPAALL
jgi:copper chaperone CopZ